LAEPRRDDRDAGGEHPERPPELGDRVRALARRDLERLALGNLLEVRADPLGRARNEAAPQRNVELVRQRVEARLHTAILTDRAIPARRPPRWPPSDTRRASSASARASAPVPCPARSGGRRTA